MIFIPGSGVPGSNDVWGVVGNGFIRNPCRSCCNSGQTVRAQSGDGNER